MVIILHASAKGFYGRFEASSSEFQACNFFNGIVRPAEPLFVMMSGMFLLDERREYPIRKLYFVKILRIAVAYLAWAVFYSAGTQFHAYRGIHLRQFVFDIIGGHYHMWFLYMISGLYVATPILRWISRDDKICRYFIALGFVSVFVCNCIESIPVLRVIPRDIIGRLDLKIVAGFSTYYLLGHYLTTHKPCVVYRRWIYALGGISVLTTVVFNGWYSAYTGHVRTYVFNNLWANTFFWAVVIFVFFQENLSRIDFSPRMRKWISRIARLSFGMYLVHAFLLDHLYWIALPHFFVHPVFAIPVTAMVTFALSFFTAYVIDQIPWIRKWVI